MTLFRRADVGDDEPQHLKVSLDLKSVWHATWIVIGALALLTALGYLTGSAGSVVFNVVMAFFLAAAIEPAVSRFAKHMPRALATGLVVLLLACAVVGFFAAFGGLLVDEVQALISAAPGLVTDCVDWVNRKFDTDYDINKLLSSVNLTPDNVANYGSQLAGGVLGLVTSVVSTAFNLFVLIFFTCYISAGLPRLRTWVAGLFPPRQQRVVLTVWEVFVAKVGGYVAARFILATISATIHGTFMMLIGMPYWLALGLWTGIIAQFVPNIGTYISIVLPVLVGATSDKPITGLFILIFAIVYQQIENVTIEPNISARAVDVHPAVSFASALAGANMFGLAGGLLGVPAAATAMAILDLYKTRYEVKSSTLDAAQRDAKKDLDDDDSATNDDPPGQRDPVELAEADSAANAAPDRAVNTEAGGSTKA